ncbi:hypothetical protein ACFYO0_09030 [Streptomyces sp. NPDC006365]|uniref:hypothetical protein n=1 Tax=Streptomyces sp. NPDC006365 TaxID=3364744 RepID=UPI00369B888A
MLTEAVAGAILNHPRFVVATPDSPREDTITVQSRCGIRYRLTLDLDLVDPGSQEPSTPAADVASAVDRVLMRNPSDAERATAELLNYISATWQKQDIPLREHHRASPAPSRPPGAAMAVTQLPAPQPYFTSWRDVPTGICATAAQLKTMDLPRQPGPPAATVDGQDGIGRSMTITLYRIDQPLPTASTAAQLVAARARSLNITWLG